MARLSFFQMLKAWCQWELCVFKPLLRQPVASFCPQNHDRFVWRAKRAAANHPTTILARDHPFIRPAQDGWQPINETLDNRLVQAIAL